MKKIVVCFLCISVLFCCQQNTYFNNFEESLLSIYGVGDTLVFTSNLGEVDTLYITDKHSGYAGSNPLAHSGNYKMLSAVTNYGSSKKLVLGKMYPYKMIEIIKNDPENSFIFISIDDVNVSWNLHNFSALSWNKYRVGKNLFRFNIVRGEDNMEKQSQIYFHLKFGVVKYVKEDGSVWTGLSSKYVFNN